MIYFLFKQIIIFSDNDNNYTGQKAAYLLANKLAVQGKSVMVKMPDKQGTDFNDVLRKAKK